MFKTASALETVYKQMFLSPEQYNLSIFHSKGTDGCLGNESDMFFPNAFFQGFFFNFSVLQMRSFTTIFNPVFKFEKVILSSKLRYICVLGDLFIVLSTMIKLLMVTLL